MRSDRMAAVGVDTHARVLRLLVKRHRDMAQLRATHCVRLHAMLVELTPGGIATTITVINLAKEFQSHFRHSEFVFYIQP